MTITVTHELALTDTDKITVTGEGESLYLAHCRAAVEIDNIVARLHAQRYLVFKHAYAARAEEAAKPQAKPAKQKRKTLKLKKTA